MADKETTMAIGAVVVAFDTLVKMLDDKGVMNKRELVTELEMICSNSDVPLDPEFTEVMEHIIERINSWKFNLDCTGQNLQYFTTCDKSRMADRVAVNDGVLLCGITI